MIATIIFLALILIETGFRVAKDGEKRDNYHFGWYFVNLLIMFTLLFIGGFFDKFFN